MRRSMVRLLAGTALMASLAPPAAADFAWESPIFTVTETGLDLPVPPLLTPAELLALQTAQAAAIAADLNAQWNNPVCFAATGVTSPYSATGTTVTKNGPPTLGALTPECFSDGVAALNYVRTTSRRTTTTVVGTLIDNTGGAPPGFTLTARGTGVSALTANAVTFDGATGALLLALRTSTGRRYGAGAATLTGGGPLVVSDVTLSERVTARDITYIYKTYVGPGPDILTGDILGCDTPAGCYGGIFLPDIAGTTITVPDIDLTLHITRTVERTLTAGTSLYDLAVFALPSGVAHAAGAGAALDTGDRFLRRLADLGAAPETGRWLGWAEATGGRSTIDASALTARIDRDGWGAAFGFAYAPSADWTLGLAAEFGDDEIDIVDTLTPERAEATRWQVAAHARYSAGRFDLSAALAYGETDTETSSASGLGDAQADYTLSFTGAAIEGGYALIDGPFRLTAQAGVTLLSIDMPDITETGAAPLAIAGDSFAQQRWWAGLSADWTGATLSGGIHIRAIETAGDEIIALTASDPLLGGDSWLITGPDTGGTALSLGGDIAVSLGANATLSLAYEGRFADGADAHDGRATISIKW